MNRFFLFCYALALSSLFPYFLQAQSTVFISDNPRNSQKTVKIAQEVSFPDIKVRLGRDIPFEDITVGITDRRNRADVILTDQEIQAERSIRLDNEAAFPDLRILYGPEVSFPDIRIEFRGHEPLRADVLIYTENTTVSEQELIAALLPYIRRRMNTD